MKGLRRVFLEKVVSALCFKTLVEVSLGKTMEKDIRSQ